jgi:hypothetical protein
MNSPIIITGAARSGVPIVASIINHAGAWGGIRFGEGYDGRIDAENNSIKKLMMKPVLNGLRADDKGQAPLPRTKDCKRAARELAPAWKRRVERIICKQGYVDGPWFYASARICLVWPIWHAAFPDAQWIIVRRDDKRIVRACLKTWHMDAYNTYKEWQAWLGEYKQKFNEISQAGINTQTIWPERFIKGNFDELKKLVTSFNLDWDEQGMEDFLSPILWKIKIFRSDGGFHGNKKYRRRHSGNH